MRNICDPEQVRQAARQARHRLVGGVLARQEQRYLYVMNGGTEQVHILDHASGEILSSFGRPGPPDRQLHPRPHHCGGFAGQHLCRRNRLGPAHPEVQNRPVARYVHRAYTRRHYRTQRWTMPRSALALPMAAAVFLAVPFAAQAQNQAAALPDGKGKELVSGVCTACHQTNMITQSSGYTLDGWKEIVGTMIDLKPTPEQHNEITAIPGGEFAQHQAGTETDPRQHRDHVQGMGDADARPAFARSGSGGRRVDLVGRAIRQPDRTARSEDRRDEGIPAAAHGEAAHGVSSITTAWPGSPAT